MVKEFRRGPDSTMDMSGVRDLAKESPIYGACDRVRGSLIELKQLIGNGNRLGEDDRNLVIDLLSRELSMWANAILDRLK